MSQSVRSMTGYGRAQRVLAERYGALLVPRRHFAALLGRDDTTLDGLHLSARGHALMAEMIWRHVGALLQPSGEPRNRPQSGHSTSAPASGWN